MPDTLSPARPRPGRANDPDPDPDPDFWGPSRPGRGRDSSLVRPIAPAGAVDRLLDRLRAWRADPRAGVAIVVMVAVVAGFVWYRIGLGSGGTEAAGANAASEAPATTPVPASAAPSSTGPAGSAPPAEGGDVTVHWPGRSRVPASSTFPAARGSSTPSKVPVAGSPTPTSTA